MIGRIVKLGAFTMLLGCTNFSAALADNKVEVIDTVVASVDGDPITLQDIEGQISPANVSNPAEMLEDPSVQFALDKLVFRKMIEDEARSRQVAVQDSEIDSYMQSVMQQNGFSEEQFAKEIKKQGKSMAKYREEVRFDILRSKLTGRLFRDGVRVSDKEIENYIESHPEYSDSGSKCKLREIFISSKDRSTDELDEIIKTVESKFSTGEKFAKLARDYSERPDAGDGGLLGVVAEKDLDPEIFDAIFSLKKGEISKVLRSDMGYRIFYLEDRYKNDGKVGDDLRAEIKKTIEQDKVQTKMQNYFTNEMFKQHVVEKNI